MEAGVRYSAAGVVAEAHLATCSHSAKLLRDLPSPKRCGTRATITGSSYDAVLGPDGGRPAIWWVRASDPPVDVVQVHQYSVFSAFQSAVW